MASNFIHDHGCASFVVVAYVLCAAVLIGYYYYRCFVSRQLVTLCMQPL